MQRVNSKEQCRDKSQPWLVACKPSDKQENQEDIEQVKYEIHHMVGAGALAGDSIIECQRQHGERMVVALHGFAYDIADVFETGDGIILHHVIIVVPVNKSRFKNRYINDECKYDA